MFFSFVCFCVFVSIFKESLVMKVENLVKRYFICFIIHEAASQVVCVSDCLLPVNCAAVKGFEQVI